ncbi:SRPBCC family protein [Kutzneria albida]|nr:SRPBCC family protein [Kutzneria albida]
MIDIQRELAEAHRQVTADPGGTVSVVITREYRAGQAGVWNALTDPERLRRWFLPISGDLRVGGSFQLEGNAGGEIRRCERPELLEVTYGGPTSVVRVRLRATGEERTELVLEHTVPVELAGSPAGSLYVGPGWDGAFLTLGQYFAGTLPEDPFAAAATLEGQEFSKRSVQLWVAAATGTATLEEIAAAAEAALGQYAPDLS